MSEVTVSDMWAKRATYTRTASEIARNLCFAGLALVWVLRVPDGTRSAIPQPLQIGALFIVLSLLLDLAQYIVGAVLVKRVAKDFEERLRKDPKTVVEYPDDYPIPMQCLFFAKITTLLIALCFLAFAPGRPRAAWRPAVAVSHET
jgi:hypothetical protein